MQAFVVSICVARKTILPCDGGPFRAADGHPNPSLLGRAVAQRTTGAVRFFEGRSPSARSRAQAPKGRARRGKNLIPDGFGRSGPARRSSPQQGKNGPSAMETLAAPGLSRQNGNRHVQDAHPPRAASHPRKNGSSLFRDRHRPGTRIKASTGGNPTGRTHHQDAPSGWEGHKEKRSRAGISRGTVAAS